jgi:hypothetical protein
MIRLFTKKVFEFSRHGVDNGKLVKIESVTTPVLGFVNVPDWAAQDNMYKWGVQDGSISVIGSLEQELKIEHNIGDPSEDVEVVGNKAAEKPVTGNKHSQQGSKK